MSNRVKKFSPEVRCDWFWSMKASIRLVGPRSSLAGRPFIKVNPKQARRFAQAIVRLAKTDSVNAKMLARLGLVLDLALQGTEGEDVHDLRELLTAPRA